MKTKLKYPSAFVLFVYLLALTIQPAKAHAGDVSVPREAPSRPAPVVDGSCQTEYINSVPIVAFNYAPFSPLTFVFGFLLTTERDLFICVPDIPLSFGGRGTFVEMVFDTRHNARLFGPDGDDLRFLMQNNGSVSSQRGNGLLWRDDSTITGWEMERSQVSDVVWNLEARFPLALLGGATPGRVIGFSIQHRSVITEGDSFGWPNGSSSLQPPSWGNLLLREAAGGIGNLELDVFRVTQGMDFDMSAGVPYDLIAGKDTLIRAQIYTRRDLPAIQHASCKIQQLSPIRAPSPILVGAAISPRPAINPGPFGFFNGSPAFTCWVGGHTFAEPGNYRISLAIRLVGETTDRDVYLGQRTIKEAGNFRVFLFPWQYFGAPDFERWGPDKDASIREGANEWVRTTPLPTSNSIMSTRSRRTNEGLRFFVMPLVFNCPEPGYDGVCDVLLPTVIDRFNRTNAALAVQERRTGVPKERLDAGVSLQSATDAGGGQCGWWSLVGGSGFDNNRRGPGHTLAIHELLHCIGQYRLDSPNKDGGTHSRNPVIRSRWGQTLVDMITRDDYGGDPVPLMAPAVGNISDHFYEGWDWNQLRNTFITLRGRRVSDGAGPRAAAAAEGTALFHFVGSLNNQDVVQPIYSQQISDLPLALTPEDSASPYAFVFLNNTNGVLKTLRFNAEMSTPDGAFNALGLVLTTELPPGTSRVEIRKSNKMLYGETFSQAAPVVSAVNAVNHGQGGIDVTWSASDADSPKLHYNLFYEPVAGEMRYMIASGLEGNRFFYQTDLAPATPAGRIIVEATDGLNTGTATSEPFAVETRPPVVGITAPGSNAALVAGQSVQLQGYGFDYTDGDIPDTSLVWESNQQGVLGSGVSLVITLRPGTHTLKLTGTALSGMQASASIQITVQDDSDSDGLPDVYESGFACLDPSTDDSTKDADADQLYPAAERLYGTDPCRPDTDQDGANDGSEVQAGSGPKDGQQKPPEQVLFLAEEAIDLGICTETAAARIQLTTNTPNTTWRAITEQDWMTVTGNGAGDSTLEVTAQCAGLPEDTYQGEIYILASNGQIERLPVRMLVTRSEPGVSNPIYLPFLRR